MDVREKLVELLITLLECEIDGDCSYLANDWAENLIANGVTVQEWIPVTERLPENICPVLVVLEGLNTVFNGWYHDGKWLTVGTGTRQFTQKVTYWMPIPQPPKGE